MKISKLFRHPLTILKLIFFLSVLIIAGCGQEPVVEETVQKPNTLTQAELEDGWILMFNGMTPDGWRSHNGEAFPEQGWEVVNGTLHVIGSGRGEAGGGGDILFDRKFSNSLNVINLFLRKKRV